MKRKYETLHRTRGVVDALHWLPTSGVASGEQLSRIWSWQHGYQTNGLPFSKMGESDSALRQLVSDGYLRAGGKNKATGQQFNAKGLEASETYELTLGIAIAKLMELQKMKTDENGLIQGWKLAPSAFKAFYGNGSMWGYNKELTEIQKWIIPAQEMGWLDMRTDGNAKIWAVKLTPAGESAIEEKRKEIADWEEMSWDIDSQADEQGYPGTEIGTEEATEVWIEGFEKGRQFFTETPAAWLKNMISRQLSSNAWAGGE